MNCYWCGGDCGGTCLDLKQSTQMQTNDPAYWMLNNEVTSTSTVYNDDCYICVDPEFAQMGLPLCYACAECGGHTPADDVVCDNGHTDPAYIEYLKGLE